MGALLSDGVIAEKGTSNPLSSASAGTLPIVAGERRYQPAVAGRLARDAVVILEVDETGSSRSPL